MRGAGITLFVAARQNPVNSFTGIDSMEILDQALEAARTFRPMSEGQVMALLAKTAPAAARGEFEPFKTTSIFDATASNPSWLGEEPPRLRQLMPA